VNSKYSCHRISTLVACTESQDSQATDVKFITHPTSLPAWRVIGGGDHPVRWRGRNGNTSSPPQPADPALHGSRGGIPLPCSTEIRGQTRSRACGAAAAGQAPPAGEHSRNSMRSRLAPVPIRCGPSILNPPLRATRGPGAPGRERGPAVLRARPAAATSAAASALTARAASVMRATAQPGRGPAHESTVRTMVLNHGTPGAWSSRRPPPPSHAL
jgi:hypothetical protein